LPLASSVYHSLSLHDALPISLQFSINLFRHALRHPKSHSSPSVSAVLTVAGFRCVDTVTTWRIQSLANVVTVSTQRKPATVKTADRKSTRLNSSHVKISYAVF